MKESTSLYAKQHPKIRQILDAAGSAGKVLCVALDYAKAQHVALFCNGFGEILKKPFAVENSPAGLQKLRDEIQSTCTHRGIQNAHVFLGGEDNPPYAQNFMEALSQAGYLVVRVNAWEAKHQRDNHQASTDELDVPAIAKALLHQATYSDQDQAAPYLALKELSRTRTDFVAPLTEQKLHIHQYVNRLCPGFLNPKQSGVAPFGRASLALLAEDFSAAHLRRWRRDQLIRFLQRHGQDAAEAAADQLKTLARQVLAPAPHLVPCWQSALTQYVRQYQGLQQSVQALEKELAAGLVQTPGALLTSLSGVGVVIAAGVIAELGDPAGWRAVRSLCSYAGLVPRTSQSGGPDKPAHSGSVQRRCNRRAKNWLVQAGSLMGRCGPPELQTQHHQLQGRGQHADFIMSKRLLRIFKDLLRRRTVYRPKALLAPDTPAAALAAYYQDLWGRLVLKWQGRIPGKVLVEARYPLGQWRQMVQQLYKITLHIPNI